MKKGRFYKQQEVVKFLKTVDDANISTILENVPFGYYANGNKHLCELLGRMVRRGSIERIRRGRYKYVREVNTGAWTYRKPADKSQQKLEL